MFEPFLNTGWTARSSMKLGVFHLPQSCSQRPSNTRTSLVVAAQIEISKVACLRYRLRFDHFLVNICKTNRGAAPIFNLVIWNWFSILLAQQEFCLAELFCLLQWYAGNKSGVWTTTYHQCLFAAGVVRSTFSKWTSKNRPKVIWTVSLNGPSVFWSGKSFLWRRFSQTDIQSRPSSRKHLLSWLLLYTTYTILFFNFRYRRISKDSSW